MRGALLILSAASLWGAIGLFVTALIARGLGPLEIAFWRAALAGLLFLGHALVTGRWRVARRDVPALLGFALVGITGFYAAFPLAIAAGGVSLATVLLYTAPGFVVLLAPLVLKEPLRARRLLLAGLATAGVALIAFAGGGEGVRVTPASLAWGLLAGVTYATHYLVGKPLFARIDPVTVFAWVVPLGALGLLPVARPRLPVDPAVWGLLLGLAGLSTFLAYRLYAAGLARLEASRAALLATIEPVVALSLAIAFLRERPDALALAGALLVLASTALQGTSTEAAASTTGARSADSQ